MKFAKGDYCGAANNLIYAGKLARATLESADAYYIEEWRKVVEKIRDLCTDRGVELTDILDDVDNTLISPAAESGDKKYAEIPDILQEQPVCLKLRDFMKDSRNNVEDEKVFAGDHETLKGCSAALDMNYSSEKGRHMVANRYIPAGEC